MKGWVDHGTIVVFKLEPPSWWLSTLTIPLLCLKPGANELSSKTTYIYHFASFSCFYYELFICSVQYAAYSSSIMGNLEHIWVKVFKNGPTTIFGRQPLKNLKWYGVTSIVLKFSFNFDDYIDGTTHPCSPLLKGGRGGGRGCQFFITLQFNHIYSVCGKSKVSFITSRFSSKSL